MPETIRTANGGLRSCPWRGGILAAFVSVAILGAAPARADNFLPSLLHGLAHVSGDRIGTATLIVALVCFAVLAVLVLLRTRRSAAESEQHAREERSLLKAECDRLKALLTAEPQVLIAWAAGDDAPDIVGDASIFLQGEPQRILAFGAWLDAASAQQLEHAVDALRAEGRAFVMSLTTRAGRPIEAEGRAIGGIATLRIRDLSGL